MGVSTRPARPDRGASALYGSLPYTIMSSRLAHGPIGSPNAVISEDTQPGGWLPGEGRQDVVREGTDLVAHLLDGVADEQQSAQVVDAGVRERGDLGADLVGRADEVQPQVRVDVDALGHGLPERGTEQVEGGPEEPVARLLSGVAQAHDRLQRGGDRRGVPARRTCVLLQLRTAL